MGRASVVREDKNKAGSPGIEVIGLFCFVDRPMDGL